MFFRNLTLFRFDPALKKAFDTIETTLEEFRLKPVGPVEPMSRGFVSPFGRDRPALSHRVGAGLWLIPPLQRTNSMAIGAIADSATPSWPAPLGSANRG